jgi:outer membrane protein OmpA-like peptidoglycan-associated protein
MMASMRTLLLAGVALSVMTVTGTASAAGLKVQPLVLLAEASDPALAGARQAVDQARADLRRAMASGSNQDVRDAKARLAAAMQALKTAEAGANADAPAIRAMPVADDGTPPTEEELLLLKKKKKKQAPQGEAAPTEAPAPAGEEAPPPPPKKKQAPPPAAEEAPPPPPPAAEEPPPAPKKKAKPAGQPPPAAEEAPPPPPPAAEQPPPPPPAAAPPAATEAPAATGEEQPTGKGKQGKPRKQPPKQGGEPPAAAGQPPAEGAQPPAPAGQAPPPTAGGQQPPPAAEGQPPPPPRGTEGAPKPPPAAEGQPPAEGQQPPAAAEAPLPPPPPPPPPPPAGKAEGPPPAQKAEGAPPPLQQVQPPPAGKDGAIAKAADGRVILRLDGQVVIRHDDQGRFRQPGAEVYQQKGPRGTTVETVNRPNGVQIVTTRDQFGNIIRRERRMPDGRVIVLIDSRPQDERQFRQRMDYLRGLPPVRPRIPMQDYIVESQEATPQQIYGALTAPPVEEVQQPYTLDEIRQSGRLRDMVPRVDVDTITFDFGQATVPQDQVGRLNVIGDALKKIIQANPKEVYLIEGHTDAVGSDLANLALSDRRAESVAEILTYYYQIPPENLVTQGYGEQYLKVPTEGPERENRRVTLRRITPLLDQQAAQQ